MCRVACGRADVRQCSGSFRHRRCSEVDWKRELVVGPVLDVDHARTLYVEQAGFDPLVGVASRTWAAVRIG